MIVFTTIDPVLFAQYAQQHPDIFKGVEIRNICSYDARFPMIYGLIPDITVLSENALLNDGSLEFETEYANYLLGPGFISFMNIAYSNYLNADILYVYQFEDNSWFDSVIESISHLLSQRFGMESSIIKDPEDIPYMNMDRSLSVLGLANIDQDYTRYVAAAYQNRDEALTQEENRRQWGMPYAN